MGVPFYIQRKSPVLLYEEQGSFIFNNFFTKSDLEYFGEFIFHYATVSIEKIEWPLLTHLVKGLSDQVEHRLLTDRI